MKQSKNIAVTEYRPFTTTELDTAIGKHAEKESTTIGNASELYNLTDLYLLSQGDEKFVEKMIKIFIEQMPALVTKMEGHYKQQQYKAMGTVAHTMKPAIDSMEIVSLKSIIREIEVKGKSEMFNEAMPGLMNTLKITMDEVVNLLKIKFER